MIEIRTLGTIDLRAPAPYRADAVLRQPARFTLLVYLALDGAEGYIPRDRILAVFWPDVAEGPARSRLRQALHYLCDCLGPILERSGDHALRCNGRVTCDAAELVRLVASGEAQPAKDLYRGPFLDGFHVDRAPNTLEDWISATRAWLRRQAVDAFIRVATEAGRRGNAQTAMQGLERALETAPDDDHVLARVVHGMQQYGNGTGMRRAMAVLGRDNAGQVSDQYGHRFRGRLAELTAAVGVHGVSDDDVAAIYGLLARWFHLARNADWHRALRAIALPDVIVAPPGEPVQRGIDDVLAWYTRRPPARRIDYEVDRITASGDLALITGRFAVTVAGAAGDLVMRASFTSGMMRQPDGDWRVFHSSWTPVDDGPVL